MVAAVAEVAVVEALVVAVVVEGLAAVLTMAAVVDMEPLHLHTVVVVVAAAVDTAMAVSHVAAHSSHLLVDGVT